jgi:AcrR family transcriptional regulator
MPRPNQTDQQRKRLLPIVCRAFSELGYRRTTTAELAQRCRIRENILYRLWPDKKCMFLAAIDDIFQRRVATWRELLADHPSALDATECLLAYEAKHQGEFGFYRVVFTALAEIDDADIRDALVSMYHRFHQIVTEHVEALHGGRPQRPDLPGDIAAWALIGLATVSNIIRELKLLKPRQRERMFAVVAERLIRGAAK